MNISKHRIRNIIIYISMFLVLLYPFNATIENIIYPSNIICFGSIILGALGLILTKKKFTFKKNALIVLGISLLIAALSLFNNYYLIEGRSLKTIIFTIYLFLPFIFLSNEELGKPFYKILKLFAFEHIIGTFIGVVFKSYYKNVILTKLCAGRTICTAIGNNYHGYMTGFTTHFSTNAIYLSIASLLFFSEVLEKKSKKAIVLFALSIIALFTTGKRAHLIFTVFCCIALYLVKRSNNIIKKYTKLFAIVLVSVCSFVVVSKYVPEMTNMLIRFENLIEKGDIMNGRKELYDLAFNMWDKHLLLGNGWGSFSYQYQMNLYTPGAMTFLDAHNVFIQLLCEVGIIGFLIFTLIMLSSFVKSFSNLKNNENKLNYFIFGYQLFFILYCFTGNPLYDPMCYVIYFITIGLTFLYQEKGVNNK